MSRCIICHKPTGKGRNAKYCAVCYKAYRKEYMKKYQAENRKFVNEYNRWWMAQKRKREKNEQDQT